MPVSRLWARSSQRGQAVAEFALILPIMVLLAVALADFGRVYASIIAVEAAAREAADYGAFQVSHWTDTQKPITEAEMLRRSCTAARHLPSYEGAADGQTCTNPGFAYDLEPSDPACTNTNPNPPCIVHVTLTYQFETLIHFPPLPDTVTIVRESRFSVTDLPDPDATPTPGPSFSLPTPAPPTPEPTPEPPPEPTPEPTPGPSDPPTPGPTDPPTPEPTDPPPDPTDPPPDPTDPPPDPTDPPPDPTDPPPDPTP